MDHVCVFRHALALDEPRSLDARDDGSDWARAGDVKEVWFPGSREHMYVYPLASHQSPLSDDRFQWRG